MNVIGLDWVRFRIPFRTGFATSRGVMTHREGWLVRLRTADGHSGLGEASPLAEHTGVAGPPVRDLLEEARAALLGCTLNDVDAFLTKPYGHSAHEAAVRCALDTAALDLRAQAAGVGIARLLDPRVLPEREAVPVNVTIGGVPAAEAARLAAAAREAGFRTIKLKVGVAGSIDEERARVAAVREAAGPGVALRLDANGAWDVEQAVRSIRAFEPYGIEMLEQPVAPGDLAAMRAVRDAVDTPIAADEDVAGPDAAGRVIDAGAADVLVVKPMMAGGLRAGRRIMEAATAAGLRSIVTTTLDAGVGTAAAVHLAATLPPGSPACGLATAALLEGDLVTGLPAPDNGAMPVPRGPGLGVALDSAQLARFGGRWEVAA